MADEPRISMVTTGQFDGKAVCRDGHGLYIGIWRRGVHNPRLNADTVESFELVELPERAPAQGGSFLGFPVRSGTVLGRSYVASTPAVVVRMVWKDGNTSVLLLEQDDFDRFARDVRPGWESNPRTTD